MKRVLLVDDEQRELDRYREMLADLQPEWELSYATSGADALKLMFQQPFDVVVADLSLPEMDGVSLLNLILQRYPSTVRLIACTQEEKAGGLRVAGAAHQDVGKPANREELVAAIERTVALRDLLNNDKLKGLVSQILSLPSMPDLYLKLLDELNVDEPSIERVGDVIQRDPAMAAKLLQLVNSAFFGLPQKITNLTEAAMYVGVDTIKALVLSLQFFALFERVRIPEFSFDALWAHSWEVGKIARRIARCERLDFREVDLAFTAGLLHDAGKLVLATGLPNQYQAVLRHQLQQPKPLWAAERALLGASHAEVGAYLTALWALPDPLVEALAWHHWPAESLHFGLSPLLIVHVADFLEQESRTRAEFLNPIDLAFLEKSGVADRLEDWRAAAQGEET